MFYGKESYKKDIPFLEKAKATGDALSFTYLFDKYYNIVLYHLQINFREVRVEVLEDAAIETIEDWFLSIENKDYEANLLGFILCRNAKGKIFKMLRPKTKFIPFSKLSQDDEKEAEKFINQLIYTNLNGEKGIDQAKVSFMLKKKADNFISELSDKNYKIITLYLDGLNFNQIRKKLSLVSNSIDQLKIAFRELRNLIFDERNAIFDKQRKQYFETKVKFKHPKIMRLYYEEKLSIRAISDIENISYDMAKRRLKLDRDLMKYEGLSYHSWKKLQSND